MRNPEQANSTKASRRPLIYKKEIVIFEKT